MARVLAFFQSWVRQIVRGNRPPDSGNPGGRKVDFAKILALSHSFRVQAAVLLGTAFALHYRWLLNPSALIGAPQSDLIRGVWGFDHQARGFPIPFWTDRIGFPEGVKILILPFFSSYIATPLAWVLGSFAAYNIWVLLLMAANGIASAFAARSITKSPWAGWLAGMMMISQPMLFLAITDGTPENVAFWSVPVFLGLVARALEPQEGNLRMAGLAGLAVGVVAMDSPYHAVFAVPLFIPIFFLGQASARARARVVLAMVPGALAGVLAIYGLYYGLPVGGSPSSNLGNNATQVRNWIQWEQGVLREPWDWTFSPSFIPIYTIAGCILLGMLNIRRSFLLILIGVAALVISLGPGEQNVREVASLVGGELGATVGKFLKGAADLQAAHPIPVIRFLRRWLVPAALALALAAELGIGRYQRLQAIGPIAGLLALILGIQRTGYPQNLPLTTLPQVEAAHFIADHEVQGVTLILPRIRAATRLHQRDELPVYANLGYELSSASELFLQVATEQPSVYSPTGLITMVARTRRTQEIQEFFRDLDDLTLPQTIGNAIPPSATQNPEKRQAIADALFDQGIRFVMIDEEVFGEVGLALVKVPFANHIAEERHFEDGTGITVLVLK